MIVRIPSGSILILSVGSTVPSSESLVANMRAPLVRDTPVVSMNPKYAGAKSSPTLPIL